MAIKKKLGRETVKGKQPAVTEVKKQPVAQQGKKKKAAVELQPKRRASLSKSAVAVGAQNRKSGIELSVIIPAYNELKRLPLTLADIDRQLRQMDLKYEILVVDDGSTDGTPQMVEGWLPMISGLRLLINQENHGKGYVVRQGMLAAKGEVRLFMDADNSTAIDQYEKMRPYFKQGVPIVIGSRAVRGAELDPPQPWYKRLLGKLGNIFIQLVAVRGIWDTQCGFKAFSATAAADVFGRAKVDRWAFDIEALALARKLGYEIVEVPVRWVNDLRSHVKLSAYLQVLWETVKIAWRMRRDC